MILRESGRWRGKGNLLTLGSTVSQPMVLEASVQVDDTGATITGDLDLPGFGELPLSVRVAEDDTGLYALDLKLAGRGFEGSAKMESLPNMGFLWSDVHPHTASYTLFEARESFGCRGFAKLKEATYTWELALMPFRPQSAGDNVVSLRDRRR